jgi:cation diffusion facilitator CzcD-associated flavoprotein CzcO
VRGNCGLAASDTFAHRLKTGQMRDTTNAQGNRAVSVEEADVVIVGAGPYGLSLAAQLRKRKVSFRIIGQAMKFWRDMPIGINLKSPALGTNIYVPKPGYTFPEWCRQRGLEDFEPCTMQSFAQYGLWMQERFVPELESEEVMNVSAAGRGFDVTLSSGRRINARRIVFATGLSHMARIPEVLRHLPRELASHTFFLSDYSKFYGKEVAILGGGASAIEAGALVHEAGGQAQVLVRGAEAEFHGRSDRVRPMLERIREPMTVMGAGRRHWILQHFPLAVHFLPEGRRVRFVKRYLGPASPWWIKDRVLGKVPIQVKSEVTAARLVGDRVRLTVRSDGHAEHEIEVDRVIAGTGYDSDLDRLPYLDAALRERILRTERAPALSMRFQSSVKGLYFVGPMSAMSFGPLFRFVAGANFTARTLARHLGGPLAIEVAPQFRSVR